MEKEEKQQISVMHLADCNKCHNYLKYISKEIKKFWS